MSDQVKGKDEKVKQIEDLLEKSEKRAERLKILNDQIKKQLEFEKEKNDEIHRELNNLKQQVFRAQKDYKDVKEQLDNEIKKSDNLSKELEKKAEINICLQCHQPIVQGGSSNLQKLVSPHLSQNMIQSLYTQNGNNGANIFTFQQNEGPVLRKNQSNLSISSQSSQVSDEENPPLNFERTRKRTMTISVRYNNDKGADHIRAISKSIVARNYESEYQDGATGSQLVSPYKDLKLLAIKSLEKQVKQVASSHSIIDEIKDQIGEEQSNGEDSNGVDSGDGSVQFEEKEIEQQQSPDTSQELPQIFFNKKSSSNKTSQFKQQVHIKFQRRMSKTHSTIRSTIEHIDDSDNAGGVSGLGSQSQSIKSIIITKKSNTSMQEITPDDTGLNAKSPVLNKESSINNQVHTFERQISTHAGNSNNVNNIQETLNQIPEEGLSLSTSHANSLQTNNKLFEKFFILGCEKDDMKEFDLDGNTTEGLLPGKILYSYPDLNPDDPQDQGLKVIHEFAFPKGIKSKKIKITSSFRKITQYVLSHSKQMVQSKFYMFTMKSSNYFDNLGMPRDNTVLNSINPHKLMYCFCFKSRDYLETTSDESYYSRDNQKYRTFWESKKVYCFVSYYPFYELFQEMLINVLNQVKISRTSAFSEFETSDPKILYKLDGDCIKRIVKDNMESVFISYRNINITDFQQIIMIDTLAGPYKYIIGNQQIINTQTHKWSLALTLSNLSLQNLMFIFHAILLENTIVFTSKNKCLLTQTIHTFEQIIHPFSWPYPIIYLLPDTLQTLFDSPVPIIMGVNKTTQQLQSEDVYSKYQDHIFFDLDQHKIYCNNKQVVKRITSDQSYLNNLHTKIERVYQQINPSGLIQKKPSIFSDPTKKESEKHKEEYQLKYFCTKQDDQISEIILNIFNESLRQCFVDILPQRIENMLNHEDNQIDYQAFSQTVLQKSYPQDKAFIKNFINTQIFTYFIENYYQFD